MLAKVITAALDGIEALPVTVEAYESRGLPGTTVVGLGDTSVKEAVARIRAAISSSGAKYPDGHLTLNLSPAWLHKSGTHFDLAMAVCALSAAKAVFDREIEDTAFIGELSLDGTVRSCRGVLPMVLALAAAGVGRAVVPADDLREASLAGGIRILGASTLSDVMDWLNLKGNGLTEDCGAGEPGGRTYPDYSEIKGQEQAKRAVMIAAAGGHGILLTGSPGTGKTMLAERMPGILPKPSEEELLEIASIYSVAGDRERLRGGFSERPFRAPGVNLTLPGLLGNGAPPMPGEVTLAHRGVLFMDEFRERDRRVIEGLRVPLEERKVRLVRKGRTYVYPADITFAAASNPCKCGYYGDSRHECTCTAAELARYRSRISGPIGDRIDIHVNLTAPAFSEMEDGDGSCMNTEEMRLMVEKARKIQARRYSGESFGLNSLLPGHLAAKYCGMDREVTDLLRTAYDRLDLSPRALVKIKRLARTIADLEECGSVGTKHVNEALLYRERGI